MAYHDLCMRLAEESENQERLPPVITCVGCESVRTDLAGHAEELQEVKRSLSTLGLAVHGMQEAAVHPSSSPMDFDTLLDNDAAVDALQEQFNQFLSSQGEGMVVMIDEMEQDAIERIRESIDSQVRSHAAAPSFPSQGARPSERTGSATASSGGRSVPAEPLAVSNTGGRPPPSGDGFRPDTDGSSKSKAAKRRGRRAEERQAEREAPYGGHDLSAAGLQDMLEDPGGASHTSFLRQTGFFD